MGSLAKFEKFGPVSPPGKTKRTAQTQPFDAGEVRRKGGIFVQVLPGNRSGPEKGIAAFHIRAPREGAPVGIARASRPLFAGQSSKANQKEA